MNHKKRLHKPRPVSILISLIAIVCLTLMHGCYKPPLEQPYRINELNNLILQANKAFEKGQSERAESLYHEALKKSRIIQDDNATVIVLISLSRLYTSTGQIEEAKKLIDSATELSNRAFLPEDTLEELNFEKARIGFLLNENVEQLLRKLSFSNFTNIRIKSLNLIARLKIKQHEYEEAEKLLNQALIINQKTNRIEEANSLRLLGHVYLDKNNALAGQYFLKALEIDKELAIPEKIALDMETLGIFYKNMGEKQKAKEYFIRALEIWKGLGKKEFEIKAVKEIESL
ncbi:lipopolysaccharide assembly protein LapB [Thermodesulfovibrio sp. Kuro-1]|uniref:tetratricopeptide repeat protein n=1 Tax=Thermodesulfovibrio sp. Kuro-1 TaxID=2580394 RepID=UPI001142CB0D|nr:tetratricopeptide repeat protein [Thermodesulfovibrio sp. Kuro-1]